MTSAAESITESLRRSRQLMVQVSTPACIVDFSYANDFHVVSSEVIYYICFARKWKEALIPCQLLVSFPVIKPVPTMLACKVLYI